MKEIIDAMKAVPAVAEKVYTDAASRTLQEVGKIGGDAAKTIRLALFPLQFAAAFQDRLAKYIDRAVRQVPEERRIAPIESLVLPIAERLRFQEEGNIISSLYINLLSRSMDKERIGEAHPAFINIISQLAPDEVNLIEQLASADCRIYFRKGRSAPLLKGESDQAVLADGLLLDKTKAFFIKNSIEPEQLAQPMLFSTFLEHMISIGLVAYTNDPPIDLPVTLTAPLQVSETDFWFIKLSEFGRLFYSACVRIE